MAQSHENFFTIHNFSGITGYKWNSLEWPEFVVFTFYYLMEKSTLSKFRHKRAKNNSQSCINNSEKHEWQKVSYEGKIRTLS